MNSIPILSFLVGCILIGVAVIGGGFEIKEIKMPRVGVLVRLLSTGAGLAFIFLGIGLADMERSPASSVAEPSLSTSMNTLTDAAPTDTAPAPQADTVGASADPLAASATNLNTFSGFSGSSTLNWSVQGVAITGTTYMNGTTGVIRISFADAEGRQVAVDEDLQLQQAEGRFWYAGSNPRYAGTSTPFPDYEPDWLTIVQVSDGWTYGEVCDPDGCNAVMIEPGD
jgi:hypothetical protein